jgi:hypothetical protein
MQTITNQNDDHSIQNALAGLKRLPLYQVLGVHHSATGEALETLNKSQSGSPPNDDKVDGAHGQSQLLVHQSSSHGDRALPDHTSSPLSAEPSATAPPHVGGMMWSSDSPSASAREEACQHASGSGTLLTREASVAVMPATQTDDPVSLEASAVAAFAPLSESSGHASQSSCTDVAVGSPTPDLATRADRAWNGYEAASSMPVQPQGDSGCTRQSESKLPSMAVEALEDDLEVLLGAQRPQVQPHLATQRSAVDPVVQSGNCVASSSQAASIAETGARNVSLMRDSTEDEGKVESASLDRPKSDIVDSDCLDQFRDRNEGVTLSQPDPSAQSADKEGTISAAPRTVAELEDWLDL